MITLVVGLLTLLGWLVDVGSIVLSRGGGELGHALHTATNWGLGAAVVLTVVWAWERLRPTGADVFRPSLAFPAAYVLWFALGCIDFIQPVEGTRFWNPMPPRVLGLVAVGLVAYACGVLSVRQGRAEAPSPLAIRETFAGWDPRLVHVVEAVLYCIVLGSYTVLVRSMGIPALADDPNAARLAALSHGATQSVFLSGVQCFVPFSLAWIWGGGKRVSALEHGVTLTANFLLLILLLSFASKGMVVGPALLALLVAHYVRRQLTRRIIAGYSIVGALFLSTAGIWRDLHQYGIQHFAKVVSWGFPAWSLPFTYIFFYVRGPVVTFRDVLGTIPRFVDFQYGKILLSPFAIAFLPGHHESSDLFFRRILRSQFVGFGQPATLLGSLYADLGVAGIVAGLAAFGVLSQFIYQRFARRTTPFRLLLHVWIVKVGLLSFFSSLFPYPETWFVPVLLWVACLVVARPQGAAVTATAASVRT